mmetsp:Transcript_154582/g.267736  ORF Transcript_154582/g.267736 Transcript_154582/m.267736 type:complete len:249 (+) Transcript_154582:526-1272(+)
MRCGQPSAWIRPLISLNISPRFVSSSTLIVLMASFLPVGLCLPNCTTPAEPAPSLDSLSNSISCGGSPYWRPSISTPVFGETRNKVGACRHVPKESTDQLFVEIGVVSKSSNRNAPEAIPLPGKLTTSSSEVSTCRPALGKNTAFAGVSCLGDRASLGVLAPKPSCSGGGRQASSLVSSLRSRYLLFPETRAWQSGFIPLCTSIASLSVRKLSCTKLTSTDATTCPARFVAVTVLNCTSLACSWKPRA